MLKTKDLLVMARYLVRAMARVSQEFILRSSRGDKTTCMAARTSAAALEMHQFLEASRIFSTLSRELRASPRPSTTARERRRKLRC